MYTNWLGQCDCTLTQKHTMHWVGRENNYCCSDLVSLGWRLSALYLHDLKELGWAAVHTGLHLETAACFKMNARLPFKGSLFSCSFVQFCKSKKCSFHSIQVKQRVHLTVVFRCIQYVCLIDQHLALSSHNMKAVGLLANIILFQAYRYWCIFMQSSYKKLQK